MTRSDDAQSGHAVVPGLAREKGQKSEEERDYQRQSGPQQLS
ncbi:MAG TPA: hypothetical protein VGN34_15045 [Ktedonobacteraceae bacterium]